MRSRTGLKKALYIAGMTALLIDPAFGCPFCDGPSAKAVHTAIFDDRFARTLGVIALPFAVMGAFVAWLSWRPGK
jgi:hypothetical protein